MHLLILILNCHLEKPLIYKVKAPPIFFSSGLFGSMPTFIYSDLINNIKKEFTIVSINNNNPIVKKDIDNIVELLNVDSISYLSHSSFFPEVLESSYINSATLLDPICIPNININGIETRSITVDYPVHIIRAEKLYNTDIPLPEWQELSIKGNVIDEIYLNVGHPDILNDRWADIAKSLNLWETANIEKMSFKNWNFKNKNEKEIKKLRSKYRKDVANKIKNLVDNI